jgi:hypothetical protein
MLEFVLCIPLLFLMCGALVETSRLVALKAVAQKSLEFLALELAKEWETLAQAGTLTWDSAQKHRHLNPSPAQQWEKRLLFLIRTPMSSLPSPFQNTALEGRFFARTHDNKSLEVRALLCVPWFDNTHTLWRFPSTRKSHQTRNCLGQFDNNPFAAATLFKLETQTPLAHPL